ncbi:MAG: pyridoxal phosphate-dependent aminotransferase family protein [Pseudomonadota bacterium]
MLTEAKKTKPLFEKFAAIKQRHDMAKALGQSPIGVPFDQVISPTRGRCDGREILLFGTNNYLGLTYNENVCRAMVEAIGIQGSATTGSRQANGTYGNHTALEASLKAFFGAESAVVFTTGYQTNLGAISALAGTGDHLLIDADSHACIYDACRLSDAETHRFRHNDPDNLDKRLRRLPEEGGRLVVVEGMYSMFGDVAPLAEMVEVAHVHGALIFVDEAHSFGCFGENGRGIAEAHGVLEKVDFLSGTFSKSLASIGGFCISRHAEFESIRLVSRAYMFTASGAPANIAAAHSALDVLKSAPELRHSLWAMARKLHAGLSDMGFDLCAPAAPVIAVRRPDEVTAVREWNQLFEQGVYVNLAVPPATPAGTCLLRLSVSAAHTGEEVERVLEAFSNLS